MVGIVIKMLSRFSPLDIERTFRNMIPSDFDKFFELPVGRSLTDTSSPYVDMWDTGKDIKILVDLPGVCKDSINVEVNAG